MTPPSLISDVEETIRRPTVREIQVAVAAEFRIPLIEMESARRARAVVRPRQIAMYLAKELTLLSLPQIGHRFGKRDHTTVMHACQVVERLLSENAFLPDNDVLICPVVGSLRDRLRNPGKLALPLVPQECGRYAPERAA